MWVRTVSGWVFFDVTYTIQGMTIIKTINNKNNERQEQKTIRLGRKAHENHYCNA
jgi:hypothetical protein